MLFGHQDATLDMQSRLEIAESMTDYVTFLDEIDSIDEVPLHMGE